MSEILVIKCNALVKPETLENLRKIFIKQKEDGVIVLPAMCEAVVVPDDVWIVMERKEKKERKERVNPINVKEKENE